MFLPYGRKDGHLIHISEVESGVSDLRCPYCEGNLIAKKGKKMAHHFAHTQKSCWSNSDYDFFALKEKNKQYLSLLDYAIQKQKEVNRQIQKLNKKVGFFQKNHEKIQQNIKKIADALKSISTQNNAAKVALQALKNHLNDESQMPPQLYKIRHSTLFSYTDGKEKVHINKLTPNHQYFYPTYYHYPLQSLKNYHSNLQQLKTAKTQLQLYEQDKFWFEQFKLYCLEIRTGEYAVFYKIGLSSRPLEQRIKEIERVLSQHFPVVKIKVLLALEKVAFLESFFKQKYRNSRYALANFTEYFQFESFEVEAILKELKMLST